MWEVLCEMNVSLTQLVQCAFYVSSRGVSHVQVPRSQCTSSRASRGIGAARFWATSGELARSQPRTSTTAFLAVMTSCTSTSAVDNVNGVTTEFDRTVSRYVRALRNKNVSQTQARAVLKKGRVRRRFLFL